VVGPMLTATGIDLFDGDDPLEGGDGELETLDEDEDEEDEEDEEEGEQEALEEIFRFLVATTQG